MGCPQRIALRAAVRVDEQLSPAAPAAPAARDELPWPSSDWDTCQRLIRQLREAQSRGWHQAAQRLQFRLLQAHQILQLRLAELTPQIRTSAPAARPRSLRTVYGEILALLAELEDVRIDLRAGTLSAVTERILLEETDLGRFEICLDYGALHDAQPYEVIALDPYPAASNSSVTHPHVQDGHLCEGEGRAAICRALAEGRLYDFFTIVSQILRTYNPASAYVGLEDWGGELCEDCGEIASEDDRVCCEGCERLLCWDCQSSCTDCGYGFCDRCTGRCAGCDELVCRSCRRQCRSCGECFCKGCLTEDETCETCHCETCHAAQAAEEIVDGTIPNEPASATGGTQRPAEDRAGANAPLHPVCLGEAPRPA